jgi:hypothetical protein
MIWELVAGLGWMLIGIGATVVIMEMRRKEREHARLSDLTALELASEAASLLEDIEAETPAEERALENARSTCAYLVAAVAIGRENSDSTLDLDPLEKGG